MKNFAFPILFFFLFFTFCTSQKQEDNQSSKSNSKQKIKLNYAKGFTIQKIESGYFIQVKNAWKGNKKVYNYVLSRKNIENKISQDTVFIHIPVKKAACLTTTHIGFIKTLQKQNSIAAIAQPQYIFDSTLYAKVQTGKIQNLGNQQAVNIEKLVNVQPDVVFGYGISAASIPELKKMQELTHKVVLVSAYMEKTPLGKAEWIKFFGAFYDDLDSANVIFDRTKKNYLEIKSKAESYQNKPTVFAGFPWNGTWYMPGGNSFQAQFFKAAGANYIWKNNKNVSGMPLSFETVLAKAHNADFWVNLNAVHSLPEIKNKDERLTTFKAFKTGNIYNNDKRISPYDGEDYWESGVMKPDIILRDLVKIFHPDAFPNDSLYFYRKLK